MSQPTEANDPTEEKRAEPASLVTVMQFVKHFSFDNPNGRAALAPTNVAPSIQIDININLLKIDDSNYEVDLILKGGAKTPERQLFAFDLTYTGVYQIKNLLPQQIHPVMMIDAPRLLFPFARAIIAEESRNGGFPPLYIEPIDFVALYTQKLKEFQAQQQATRQ